MNLGFVELSHRECKELSMPKSKFTRKDMVVDEDMEEIQLDPEKLTELCKEKPKPTSRKSVKPQQPMTALRQNTQR